MRNFDWWKSKYRNEGEQDTITVEGRIVTLPEWLWRYMLNKIGLKSKKRRIVNKVLKREVHKAIRRGIEE